MKQEIATNCFGALSQSMRLDTIRRLIKAGPNGLNAGVLAEALDIRAPTMSFHLKELTQAGLITARRQGRNIFYTANFETLRDLIEFLMDDCCGGDPRLCPPFAAPNTPNDDDTKEVAG